MGVKGAMLKHLMRETEKLAGLIKGILKDEGSKRSPNTITFEQLKKFRRHEDFAAVKKLFYKINVALGGDKEELEMDSVKEIKADIKMYLKDPHTFEIVNPTVVQKMGLLNELERERLKLGKMLKEFVSDEKIKINHVPLKEIVLGDIEKLRHKYRELGQHKHYAAIVTLFKNLNRELGSKKNALSLEDLRKEIKLHMSNPKEFK